MLVQIFFLAQKFSIQSSFGPKHFGSKIIIGKKICSLKNILVNKIFQSKEILNPKKLDFGSKEILGPKKFWVKKILGQKNILYSKKNLGSKNFFGSIKNFAFNSFGPKEILGPIKILRSI